MLQLIVSDKSTGWQRIAVPVVAGLLAFAFLAAGAMKLVVPGAADDFELRFYLPGWFCYFTGLVEICGAVLILLARTRYFGALIIISVMGGAIITHMKVNDGFGELISPLVLLAMAVFVYWNVRTKSDEEPAESTPEA